MKDGPAKWWSEDGLGKLLTWRRWYECFVPRSGYWLVEKWVMIGNRDVE